MLGLKGCTECSVKYLNGVTGKCKEVERDPYKLMRPEHEESVEFERR